MTKQPHLTAVVAALLLSSGSAIAAGDGDLPFSREVESCIAQVNDHADYEDAIRVRHTVVKIKNTFAGYVLSIDTDVFAESGKIAVREYASYCLAKGAGKPKKFTIDKVSG